jgi:hypothetical protein
MLFSIQLRLNRSGFSPWKNCSPSLIFDVEESSGRVNFSPDSISSRISFSGFLGVHEMKKIEKRRNKTKGTREFFMDLGLSLD